VIQPAFRLEGLLGSIDTLDPDDPFVVRVGLPNTSNTNLAQIQNIRTGGSPLIATLTNSNATAGELVTTASTGQSVTVTIPVNSSFSPNWPDNGFSDDSRGYRDQRSLAAGDGDRANHDAFQPADQRRRGPAEWVLPG
jgi:hypothetical protein